jgi:hypothetical protein
MRFILAAVWSQDLMEDGAGEILGGATGLDRAWRV